MDRSRPKARWLAVAAGVFAGLFLAGVVANMYVSYLSSMSDVFDGLSRLALAVQNKGPEGVQEDLAAVRVDPRWAAVLVADPTGKVVAADPASLVGQELAVEPRFGLTFLAPSPVGPELPESLGAPRLWEGLGVPTALARALGLTGTARELHEFTVAGRGLWVEEGRPLAYLYAVVRQPVLYGLNPGEWSGLLDNATLLLFILATLALAGWVWADAGRREVEGPVAWALLTLFTSVIGWATYLVVRGRNRPACPNCGRTLRPAYRACPFCGVQVRRACPSCGRAVEETWSFCAHCAAELN